MPIIRRPVFVPRPVFIPRPAPVTAKPIAVKPVAKTTGPAIKSAPQKTTSNNHQTIIPYWLFMRPVASQISTGTAQPAEAIPNQYEFQPGFLAALSFAIGFLGYAFFRFIKDL